MRRHFTAPNGLADRAPGLAIVPAVAEATVTEERAQLDERMLE